MKNTHSNIIAIGGLLLVISFSLLAETPAFRFVIWQNGKFGYIDTNGTPVIPAKYDGVSEFSDGLAIVTIGTTASAKCEIINTEGKTLANVHTFKSILAFSDGMAWVMNDNGKNGFVNQQGKLVIPLQFSAAGNFSEGLAAAANASGKWGWIDKTGKFVIPPQFDNGFEFKEGMALISRRDQSGFERKGYIDKSGKVVVEPIYVTAAPYYSDGLVRVGDGKATRYLDKTGKLVLELPPGTTAGMFQEGVAAAKIGSVAGFIDKTGKMVLKTPYDVTVSFSEGLAPVRVGDQKTGKWGCIDKSGKLVIPAQFPDKPVFKNGLAKLKTPEGIGYIDKTGKWVWKPSK